eukprot:scaffold74431_cov69-Phaeocystis_antarctica.AAC.3
MPLPQRAMKPRQPAAMAVAAGTRRFRTARQWPAWVRVPSCHVSKRLRRESGLRSRAAPLRQSAGIAVTTPARRAAFSSAARPSLR